MRRQCSFVYARPSGLCPRFTGTSALSVSRCLTCNAAFTASRLLANKADHFAACNFYLFLRTYDVSLMAGPLITVRNVGIPLQSGSLTIKRAKGRTHRCAGKRDGNFKAFEPDYALIHTKPSDTNVSRSFLLPPPFFLLREQKSGH